MILSLDAGTTSMRGILYNDKGYGRFTSQHSTSPRFPDTIRVEQDPLVWKEALLRILSETAAFLNETGETLEGITLTAFRSPVFPADREGNALLPAIMWQDRRTDDLCREMAAESSRIYRSTGLPLTSVFSAVKMLWIRKNHPELRDKTWKMAGVYDYIIFLLTGKFVTDQSVASRFNLYNLKNRKWDPELLRLFGITENLLPDVVAPGSICGKLCSETAGQTGLASGTPVITGGGDQQCAALGLGIIESGKVAVNTGTGAYVIGLSDNPVPDPEQRIFNNLSAIPGKYILEANMLTAGTIYRWFSETFMDPTMDAKTRFSTIDREIAASPAGSNGVLLIPHFKGTGQDAGMKGAFLNLDLNTSRGDMARSVLEGIALELNAQLQRIEAMAGTLTGVSVSGGMTRFPLYNQIQADIYGKTVTAWGDGEATALGAWMNGMMGLEKASSYNEIWNSLDHTGKKQFIPDPENREVYKDLEAQKLRFTGQS